MTYLDVVNKIKEYFENSELVARVENEDLDDFDLKKSTVYPLALFYVQDVPLNSPVNTFTIQLLVMDILDINKETGQDNRDYIWNQTLAIINNFQQQLRRGDLFVEQVQITGDVTAEPFTDRFDNGLAGWGVQISIQVPNTMTIC